MSIKSAGLRSALPSGRGRVIGHGPRRAALDVGDGTRDRRAIARTRRRHAVGEQRAANRGRRPRDEQPDAVAVRLDGDATEHVGGRRIQERHRGEIDHKTLALVGDAVEHVSDCRGGTEEERAGDAIDQHVAIDGERGIVGHALAIAVIGTIGGHQRGALLDARHLRHAVDEQHRAEREADQDAFGQVAEDGEQEGREQHDGIAPG